MREDSWLSERFGHPVLTVTAEDRVADLRAAGAASGPALYQAKVDARDVARLGELEALDFRVVDVNLTLSRGGGAPLPREPAPEAVRAPVVVIAEAGHREELLELAGRDYTVSRFHLDPQVPAAVAGLIKRDWIAAYLDGRRGDRLLVAADDTGGVLGFLAVLATPEAQVIDLVAVREAARGSGVGRALVGRLVAEAGGDRVDVGTQVSNIRALRFYQRLGFVATHSRYVLHRHVEAL